MLGLALVHEVLGNGGAGVWRNQGWSSPLAPEVTKPNTLPTAYRPNEDNELADGDVNTQYVCLVQDRIHGNGRLPCLSVTKPNSTTQATELTMDNTLLATDISSRSRWR